ncbi:glycoside hydrolase superfamily [Mycena vulgaris]|nr:glycoside hydrolase superfamily [Mycena vulgaris]
MIWELQQLRHREHVVTGNPYKISAFIKSLEPNQLIAISDEGFSGGIDFEANLAIDTLDFGTFHMYPSANDIAWGQQWITDHAAFMTSANKPVIMEEFGLT